MFLLLVVGNILAYMNRFAINYALLGMTSKSSDSVTNGTCFNSTASSVRVELYSESKKDYNYTEKQQSQIVGAFFYGYTISVGSAGYITGEFYNGCNIIYVLN